MIVAASTVWTVDRVDGQFVLARRPSFAPLSSALATCTTTPRHHCVLNQYYWYGDLSTVLLYGGLVCLMLAVGLWYRMVYQNFPFWWQSPRLVAKSRTDPLISTPIKASEMHVAPRIFSVAVAVVLLWSSGLLCVRPGHIP